MSSENVPPADPPLKSNDSTFRQKRLPISKLKHAIEQGKDKLRDTDIEMVKIKEIADRSEHLLYSELAGDIIVHRTRVEKGLDRLEEYERSFGVMKYLRFGKKPVVLLDECERTLSLAKSASESARRKWIESRKSTGPWGRFEQASDILGDDEVDRVSDDPSLLHHRPIIIQGPATVNVYHCQTSIKGITVNSPHAEGFSFNCHATACRGSTHNNMQFPPTSASGAPTPESATPGSGV